MPISTPIPIPTVAGLVPPQIRPQRQRAIGVRFLMAGPSDWISDPFHLDFCLELEPLPLCAFRQHKLSLPDLAWHGVTRIETASDIHLAIVADYVDPQGPWNTCYAVVGEPDDQAGVARSL